MTVLGVDDIAFRAHVVYQTKRTHRCRSIPAKRTDSEILEVRRMVRNNYYVIILSPVTSNKRSCKKLNYRVLGSVNTVISNAVQPFLVR